MQPCIGVSGVGGWGGGNDYAPPPAQCNVFMARMEYDDKGYLNVFNVHSLQKIFIMLERAFVS